MRGGEDVRDFGAVNRIFSDFCIQGETIGELGADVKKMNFIPAEAREDPSTWVPDMLGFIQKHRLHWTAFSFHPKATPVLITGWDYTPTPFWGAPGKRALSGEKFELKKLR